MPEFELGGWSPARRRSPAWARLVTRSAAIVDAAELAGILELKLELGGWSPGPAAITGAAELAGMLLVELELGGRPSAGPRLHVSTWSPYRRLSTFSHLAPTTGFAPRAADNWTLVAKKEHADRVPAAAGQLPRRLDKGNMAKGHSNSRANATAALAAVEPEP
jgi:hypothetical protein